MTPHSGVTRLDGARGKKQVWRPRVRTWGLSEANLLYWRKYLWHCWDFSAPPAVIRHPGNFTPLPVPDATKRCQDRLLQLTNLISSSFIKRVISLFAFCTDSSAVAESETKTLQVKQAFWDTPCRGIQIFPCHGLFRA